jgi:hypothetical protein
MLFVVRIVLNTYKMCAKNAEILVLEYSHYTTYATLMLLKVRRKSDFTQLGTECTCGPLHSVF